jgi:peptidyl-prolyl cis-trans isomerase SurA
MYNLKQEVLKDSRIEIAQQKLIKNILPKIGFKKYTVSNEDLWKVSDSSLIANKNIKSGTVNENTILFSYNDHSKVKVSDWILFLRNSNKVKPGNFHESYEILFPDFMAESAIENYKKRLAYFDPGFKSQLQEFKEGNMLFEIMQRKVWEKASSDSAGLLKYYQQHQQKYIWNASADAVLFSCANEAVATNSIKELEKGKSWNEIINENASQVQADSGRYELSQIPVNESTNFTVGLITHPVINKNDETTMFTKIIKLYAVHQQRNFEDARGLVINDYQNYLEQKWIEQLRKKYPVKVNEKNFQTLLK